jgi:hypothetical protein
LISHAACSCHSFRLFVMLHPNTPGVGHPCNYGTLQCLT